MQPVLEEETVGLLEADRRAGDFRSLRKSATSLSGSSSSCQVRISAGTTSISLMLGCSKKGVTTIGSPSAGMTTPVSRSLRHHWMPVK